MAIHIFGDFYSGIFNPEILNLYASVYSIMPIILDFLSD